MINDLKFDFNALADLEERAGQGIGFLFSEGRLGFNTIRLMVWAGNRWKDRPPTMEQAGQAIQDYIVAGNGMDSLANIIVAKIQESGLFENFTGAGE